MKVTLKLFGTLPKHMDGYDACNGLVMELPEGSPVTRLIKDLGIPAARLGMIAVNGKLVKASHRLQGGEHIHLFQRIFGG